jgi:hypothetical protein
VDATSASASDAGYYNSDSTGYASWVENGDTLTVCDLSADGWGVRGYVYEPYAGNEEDGTVLIKADDPSDDGDCTSVSKNISETVTIWLKVCNYAGASVVACYWGPIPR